MALAQIEFRLLAAFGLEFVAVSESLLARSLRESLQRSRASDSNPRDCARSSTEASQSA